MSESPNAFGNWICGVLAVAFLSWIFGLYWQRVRKVLPVDDGPENEPYRVYTREFDQVVRADNLRNVLMGLSLDMAKGHFDLRNDEWDRQFETANHYKAEIEDLPTAYGSGVSSGNLSSTAIAVLIDQSGSMKGEPMAWTAAGVRMLVDRLSAKGCAVEVAGFTTAGWHGGFVRQKWLNGRRPKRPGRLCATLHILYKSFDDSSFAPDCWRQMLDPNILRENIDGEAIEWAESRLLERTEKRKLLLILSDGAPVDDSTLTENGPLYLYHHLEKVIGRIERGTEVELAAIGLGYDVHGYYQFWGRADSAAEVVEQGMRFALRKN